MFSSHTLTRTCTRTRAQVSTALQKLARRHPSLITADELRPVHGARPYYAALCAAVAGGAAADQAGGGGGGSVRARLLQQVRVCAPGAWGLGTGDWGLGSARPRRL